MSKQKKYIERGRDAGTGQFVPIDYAKTHPSSTVIEKFKKK